MRGGLLFKEVRIPGANPCNQREKRQTLHRMATATGEVG